MTLKHAIEKALPTLSLYYRVWSGLLRKEISHLHTTGWLASLQQRTPQDSEGNPLPWMNYAVISLLKDRLHADLSLFEYGSGYSTEFFANRVHSVTSVEYDPEWFERIKASMPPNVELIYQAKDVDGQYCRVITTTKKRYDVVIIDGRDRVNCLKHGLEALTPAGVLLLDDSHRERYRDGLHIARERGFRALDLEGLKPTGIETERTTVFYRDGNCLRI